MIGTASEMKLPNLITPLPGPNAKKIIARDAQVISPSYTRGYPMVAKSGRGAMVEDVDGNTFLDFAAGIAVVSTGHCHPRVVEAIQKQAAELIHISGTDFYLPNMVELAERLAAVAPGKEPKKVFFGNSGTEAIEAAIKLARYHTRRDKIIAFYGCFHGRTLGSLSLTASKAVQRKGFGALLSGVFHIPYPNSYRCPYGNPSPCNCVESATILEREIFKRLVDPEEVAAVFIEPIQGEGGYVPAPKEFLLELQRICRKHGILLVSDEVQSGMGRTGKWWAGDHAGIEAAALATLDLLETQYIENARRMGEFLFGRMADWPAKHKIVGDVRGKGLMIGIEIVRDQKTKERAHDFREAIVDRAFEKGLLLLGAGENTIRVAPPLMIDEEQADFAVRILEECIREVGSSA